MKRLFTIALLTLALGLVLALVPSVSFAWPTEADWIPLINSTGYVDDPDSDFNQAHLDIVGDSINPAVMIYNDGDYIYYRIRLDGDPTLGSYVKSNTWGILIDTDQNADAYEWMARIDGRPTDSIIISQNTSQGTLGDPSDPAEVDVWVEPLDNTAGSENFKVTLAGTDFPKSSPDQDYWLEYRYPYDVWLYYMGLDDNSVIRYFVGTGTSGWTLSGDIVGTSLYTDLSSPLLPSGTTPTTGYVKFVSDLTGAGDVTSAYPGDTLYIKVEDADRNSQRTGVETVTVTVTTAAGDSETVTLTETGLNTGVFTGSITSTDGTASVESGIVEMSPIESVTVTYIDAVDAALNKNRSRTDILTAMPSADVGVTVGVSNSTPNEGDLIVFTITLTNHGQSNASGLQITDMLPSGLTYDSDNGAGKYNPVNGVWSVSSLPDAQVKTLIINATVDAGTSGTSITDNVAITFNPQLDPVSTNNSDSVSLTVQGADLALTMTVSDNTPNESDTISYVLTLLNNGTNNATGLIINDVLPTGVTYVSSTPSVGTYDGANWSGFALPNGSSTTLTISATVDALTSGQIITHFANVASADQADPITSNNTASVDIAVAGVDLNLTKGVDTASPNVGDTVVYTLTLLNESNNTATSIVVTDLLPAGVTYTGYTTTPAATGAYDSATGVWDGFSLAAGTSVTLDISATVDTGTGGDTIVNNATITSVAQTEVDTTDNSGSASITVQAANLAVTKTVDNASPNPSATVVFTVTIKNNGPSTATGIGLTDTMTSGLTYVSHTVSTGTYTSGTGVWDGFTLVSGASATLTISATVPGTAGAIETNTATVTALDQEDPSTANNTAEVDITVGGVDLKVTKTVNNNTPGATTPATAIAYTVVVENIGDFDATGITVLDSLPAGVTYVSSTATQGTYKTATDEWKTLAIASGASATLTINVTVNSDQNGNTIENTARMTAVDQTDIDITNNISKVAIYVGSTDVGITKVVDNSTPNEGDTVQYTLTVTNNGLNNATGIEVTDLLPSGVTYLSDDALGYYDSATGIWNATNAGFTDLLPGGSVSLVIDATVDAGTGGLTITNNAQITDTTQLDPDSTNDFTSASLTVQSADIAILKSVDDATPYEGDMVSFTLEVTNNGPHDATGVVITDLLPAGLTYDSDDGAGAYVPATGLWTVGSLVKFATATLTVNATADIGTGGTTITNVAQVTASDQVDPVAANNSSGIDVSPTALPWPDIVTGKTVLTFWDPVVLDSGQQKAIPGAVMLYGMSVTNQGDGSPAANSVVIVDSLPSEADLLVSAGAFTFTNGANDSGLSFTYGGVADGGDSVEFSDNNGADYNYTPDDTLPGGYDPAVTNLKITMSGTFNASDGVNHPYFNINYKMRVK